MIVVDSAAVVDALGAVDGSEELQAHLARDELHAPTFVDIEVVSAVRGLTLGGPECRTRHGSLTDFDDVRLERWPAEDVLRRRVFQLRHNLAAYDVAYVTLAEARECPLVTRDVRLARSAGHGAQIELR